MITDVIWALDPVRTGKEKIVSVEIDGVMRHVADNQQTVFAQMIVAQERSAVAGNLKLAVMAQRIIDQNKGKIEYDPKTSTVEIQYPDRNNNTYITVDLMDVRSADPIRISYDFKRDGWKIEQPHDLSSDDPGWTETAFLQAWQVYKNDNEEE